MLSKAIYDSDGVTNNFAVPFPYLNKLNVIVSQFDAVTGEPVVETFSYGFVNPSLMQVTPTPAAGRKVWVERYSSQLGRLVDFSDATTITAEELDTAYLQSWYTAQEAYDKLDLVAGDTRTLAQAVADALSYKTDAELAAAAAAASASASATSATNSANSATAAAGSATSAAASAAVAAAGVAAIGLLKANNLSDLVSAATARTNLGVFVFDPDNPVAIGGVTPNTGTFTKVNIPSGSNVSLGIAGTAATTDGIALNTGWTAFVNSGQYGLYVQRGTQVGIRSDTPFGWSSSGANAALGLKLYYDADNILAQRNGTNAQNARIYNTFTDAANNEYFSIGYVSNVAILKHTANGTGSVLRGMALSANSIGFRPANAGGDVWTMLSGSGNFVPGTDNNYDFGSSSARVRDFFLSRWADIGAYREAVVQTPAITAGDVPINCSLGNTFVVSVTAAITSFTFSNVPASGKAYDCRIVLVSDGTSRAVANPASWSWGDGTPITTSHATSGKENRIILSTRDGGTKWLTANAGSGF